MSGLGKGTITASLSFLLKSRGFRVTPVKIDVYFNVDAGTLRPQEHGEVFVTHDGMETDEDLGHYERFIHENLRRENYVTAGQVYQEVIRKERSFEYAGETVDVIPHVTDEIIRRIKLAGKVNKADIVIVEFGGTVGEYKNGTFFEATRIMKLRDPKNVIQLHVTYLPYLANVGELKSKPAQTSVHILNGMGIQPDIIVARSQEEIDAKRLEKLALFTNVSPRCIISSPDMPSVYDVPLLITNSEKNLDTMCLKLLGLKPRAHKLIKSWKALNKRIHQKPKKVVKVAMVGKYFVTGDYQLADSYVSVIESLKHASWKLGIETEITWIDSEDIEKGKKSLKGFDGIIVPQGWGARGTEGKIATAQYAREKKIPYLGLCFGMQMATIEFARNVLKFKGANTAEANPKTKYPVIHVMPNQKEYLDKRQYGGTIRLGAWPFLVKPGTKLSEAYKKYGAYKKAPWYEPSVAPAKLTNKKANELLVFERHRHRYEFNNKYREDFEKKGFIISGTSPDGELVEAIEIKNHPFFVGTQFHPEYMSRPLTPHPIFVSFLKAVIS